VDFLEKVFTGAFWVHYPRVAWSLLDAARGLRGDAPSLVALRLPAGEAADIALQAAFWLRSLYRMVEGGRKELPALLLPVRNAGESGLWLLFRDPIALDVQVLFGRQPTHAYLLDLIRPEPPPADSPSYRDFERLELILQRRITGGLDALSLADLRLDEV
jgi:hypothetical protein